MRTPLIATVLTLNSAAAPGAAPIDAENGMALPHEHTPLAVVSVRNAGAEPKTITIRKGAPPLAILAHGGSDLVLTVPAGQELLIGPLETARYAQSDGSIALDFQAGMVGTVSAHRLYRC